MNSWGDFIAEEKPTVEKLADHAKYIADLVGKDYVCCGFDFCWYLGDDDDVENMVPGIGKSSDSQNFIKALADRGFSEDDLRKVGEENIFRVFDAVIK
jgi:membrane dipeptidase